MADGITRIAVEGFKSISKRQSIDIAPLTILAGANSSGKSSIMQPLLLLKQTLEQTFDPGPLWIGGPNVVFTSTDEFLSKIEGTTHDRVLWLEVSITSEVFELTLTKGPDSDIEILEEKHRSPIRSLVLRPSMSEQEILFILGL